MLISEEVETDANEESKYYWRLRIEPLEHF